ncbi:DNA recombination protein RmuC [Rhizobacter sp. J219]|jgi:DNA recombination protein RmuC|uniref:DNA recombination protein RmuC n=1 Tax=Rhizobacter sp. J219 TaxID=2898430 RepID=UPI002150D3D2|nr:DNA recombination protein RmuC [Rhizobacter sp. J219]MCR5882743.1 DNA recombination protein RmuC [Rhizobacter sp. J219]
MQTPWWIVAALLAVNLVLLLWLAFRRPPVDDSLKADLRSSTERLERELRDELGRSAQGTRQELVSTLASFQQTLTGAQADVARLQNEQIDSFRVQLATMQQATSDSLQRFSGTLNQQLQALSEANERRLAEVRGAVEQRLTALQQGNEQKLEQMRATVDEKLHATLEQRLGESFKQVADRLEQVHRGLGEMQGLARDVGSLSRVLNNVKTRGTFGETQLAGLLEQVFTPEQYGTNVETVPNTGARVEFAIRLPGQRADGVPLWLPIDCKFPREDYERLVDAQQNADAAAAEAAAKAIELRLRAEAKTIRDKYVSPPHTTDFGILFVPTEGLYAEALRRPGLVEALQREHRVMLAGPTTLLATLSSLQMGFRTLALEKRSVEVWEVLGAVKTEFGKFGDVLAKTKKKLDEASNNILQAEVRARAMSRELRTVEALPEARAKVVLPLPADDANLTTGDLLDP